MKIIGGIFSSGLPTRNSLRWYSDSYSGLVIFLLLVVIDLCKIRGEPYLGAISRSCLSILHLCDTPDVNNTHLKRDMGSPCRRLGISPRVLSTCISTFPVSTKHLYNICTNVIQMFCGLPIMFQRFPFCHTASNQLNVLKTAQMSLESLNLVITIQRNKCS